MKNAKLDWLVEIDYLLIPSTKQNFSIDLDNTSVSSFSIKSFYIDRVTFKENNEIIAGARAEYEEDKYLLLSNNRTNHKFENETYEGSEKEIRISVG